MQPLLADLQQQLLRTCTRAGRAAATNSSSGGSSRSSTGPEGSAVAPAQQQQQQLLLSCSSVQQLVHYWHVVLESLEVAELPPPRWHEVFAHLLLTGALRAFSLVYHQVRTAADAYSLYCVFCRCCLVTVGSLTNNVTMGARWNWFLCCRQCCRLAASC